MASLLPVLVSLQRQLTWLMRVRFWLSSLWLVAGWLSALALLDYATADVAPGFRRVCSLLFWIGLIAILFRRRFFADRQRVSLLDAAFVLEHALAQPAGVISTGIGLHKPTSAQRCEENELATRLMKTAREGSMELRPRVRWRGTATALLLTATLLAFVVLHSGTWVWIALQRVGAPTRQVNWPRTTDFLIVDAHGKELTPGSILTLRGVGSAEFVVRDRIGDAPDPVLLEIRKRERRLQQIRLNASSPGGSSQQMRFRILPSLDDPVQFRIRGGDAQTMPWTTLRQELRPGTTSFSCTMTPPDYLLRPPRSIQNWVGPIALVSGSAVDFELELNQPVQQYALRAGRQVIQTFDVEDPQRIRLSLTAEDLERLPRTLELLVRMIDSIEPSGAPVSSGWYRVKRLEFDVIEDAVPTISLTQPDSNLTVTAHASVPIAASAADDFGLYSFRIELAPPHNSTLPAQLATLQNEAKIQGALHPERVQAQVGDLLEIVAVAEDACPQHQPVRTPPVQLTIVAPQVIEQELNSQITSIIRILLQQATDLDQSIQQQWPDEAPPSVEFERQPARTSSATRTDLSSWNGAQFEDRLLEEMLPQLNTRLSNNRIESIPLQSAISLLNDELPKIVDQLVGLRSRRLVAATPPQRSSADDQPESVTASAHQVRRIREDNLQLQAAVERLIEQVGRWVELSDQSVQRHLVIDDLRTLRQKLSTRAAELLGKDAATLLQEQQQFLSSIAAELNRIRTQLISWRTPDGVIGHAFGANRGGDQFHRLDQELREAADLTVRNQVLRALELIDSSIRHMQHTSHPGASASLHEQLQTTERLIQELSEARQFVGQQRDSSASATPVEERMVQVRELASRLSEIQLSLETVFIPETASAITIARQACERPPREDQHVPAWFDSIDRQLTVAHAAAEKFLQQTRRDWQWDRIQALVRSAERLEEQHDRLIDTAVLERLTAQSTSKLTRDQKRELLEAVSVFETAGRELSTLTSDWKPHPQLAQLMRDLSADFSTLATQGKRFQIDQKSELIFKNIQFRLAAIRHVDVEQLQSQNSFPSALQDPERRFLLSVATNQQEQLMEWTNRLRESDAPDDAELEELSRWQSDISRNIEQLLGTVVEEEPSLDPAPE